MNRTKMVVYTRPLPGILERPNFQFYVGLPLSLTQAVDAMKKHGFRSERGRGLFSHKKSFGLIYLCRADNKEDVDFSRMEEKSGIEAKTSVCYGYVPLFNDEHMNDTIRAARVFGKIVRQERGFVALRRPDEPYLPLEFIYAKNNQTELIGHKRSSMFLV